jgi:hypothetical protein
MAKQTPAPQSVTDPSTGKTYTISGGAVTNNPLRELGGFGLDFAPTVHGGYTLPGGHNPLGQESVTQFGTPAFNGGKPGEGYMPGDQFAPFNLPPADVYELKQKLLAAGLLTAKTLNNPAVWDTDASSAYGKAMGFANGYGMNVSDAINYYVNNPSAAASTQSVVSRASPIDLNQTYQNEAQQLTGQQAPAPQAFIDQYHSQESAAQHSRGATYTAPPSVANAADQYLQTQDPASVQAYGAASRMMDFFGLLGVNK